MTKTYSTFLGISTLFAAVAFAFAIPAMATTPNWDTSGDYVVTMEFNGSLYDHDVTIVQDENGHLTGNGGSPAGDNAYLWIIEDGSVVGDSIEFTADYTATDDAVNPLTTISVEGDIASDGTMSGTWSDNYSGSDRSGVWSSTTGVAEELTTDTPNQTEDADSNNDGFVDGAEGVPFYGGIEVSLTESEDTSPDSALALHRFTAANENGNYDYVRTITVSGETRDALSNGVIVVHGLDLNDSDEYDGDKESSLADGVPFEATVPVACGRIEEGNGEYTVNLEELNSTGVNGFATLSLNGNEVTIDMEVNGTSANLPHAQHIHIGGSNECPPNTVGDETIDTDTVTVTIEKFVHGKMATADSADNADFPMTATWDLDNTGEETGSYTLSETNSTPYRSITDPMSKGADYETKERVNGDVVGANCANGKPFALEGYTTGDTRAEAMNGNPTMTMPMFSNLQSDKYVIVWNRDCNQSDEDDTVDRSDGEIFGDVIGNDGELEVTAIEMIDTSATANGSFTDGWEYVFSITAPTSEEELAMKFDDWSAINGGGTIPAAGNMRISSEQADNNGATILVTAADTYTTPTLTMETDLDPTMDGRQVQVTVEVAVPFGTPNGTYSTDYGVQSNP